MTNPWLKKNPFMSLWLSGFNAAAGSLRGHATAQAKRHTATAMSRLTNDMAAAWMSALAPPAPPAARKKRRRR